MISISYFSNVNTLTSSLKYIYNGALITALNVCHILRKWPMYIEVNSTSKTWFSNKYIEDEIKKKVDKTR